MEEHMDNNTDGTKEVIEQMTQLIREAQQTYGLPAALLALASSGASLVHYSGEQIGGSEGQRIMSEFWTTAFNKSFEIIAANARERKPADDHVAALLAAWEAAPEPAIAEFLRRVGIAR
jgi:hypothetical protein